MLVSSLLAQARSFLDHDRLPARVAAALKLRLASAQAEEGDACLAREAYQDAADFLNGGGCWLCEGVRYRLGGWCGDGAAWIAWEVFLEAANFLNGGHDCQQRCVHDQPCQPCPLPGNAEDYLNCLAAILTHWKRRLQLNIISSSAKRLTRMVVRGALSSCGKQSARLSNSLRLCSVYIDISDLGESGAWFHSAS